MYETVPKAAITNQSHRIMVNPPMRSTGEVSSNSGRLNSKGYMIP